MGMLVSDPWGLFDISPQRIKNAGWEPREMLIHLGKVLGSPGNLNIQIGQPFWFVEKAVHPTG